MSADKIEKLLQMSSSELIQGTIVGEPHDSNSAVYKELWDLLRRKNGFYAFESALHVLPIGKQEGVLDIEKWNSEELWKYEYMICQMVQQLNLLWNNKCNNRSGRQKSQLCFFGYTSWSLLCTLGVTW